MDCLHTHFTRQAQATPDAIAVVDDHRCLTFAELDRESDQLAHYLRRHGIGTDDTVGIHMGKSVDYIVACLGALKAGGAFLPLFLDYPNSLMMQVLQQTQAKVVVTTSSLLPRLKTLSDSHLVALDSELDWRGERLAPVACDPEQLMFVVFSSGTTGEPKGITLPHRAAVHSYDQRHQFNPYQPGQRVACNIFFVWEIFRPLIRGASVYVITDDVIYDPKLLSRFLEKHQISEVLFTPSLLETMLNQLEPHHWRKRFASLEVIFLNGEVVTERLRSKALEALPETVRLLNTYSISECHDVANFDLRRHQPGLSDYCPVGYPIDGIGVRLEDEELYVSGPGLARGYLGKPHLTAERFVELDGVRYYRTGDLASLLPSGLLEIRGRCDSVVKIRGYSVHLGAVQAALECLEGVASAAAVAVGEEGKEKTLVAYVVAEGPRAWSIDGRSGASADLRRLLREQLADFMLPSLFMEVEELPLSPVTGKLDPKLLPAPPQRQSQPVDHLSLPPNADESDRLEVLRELWERLLGLESGVVEATSHFFDLGGHSLLAIRLVQHLERIFQANVTVRQLYDYPTFAKLIGLLEEGDSGESASGPVPEHWNLPLSCQRPEGMEPTPLSRARGVLVTGATGFVGAFLVDRLSRATEAPIYCLARPRGGSPQERLEKNLTHYGLPVSARYRAVAGDLGKEALGLCPDDRELLEREVDVIFHCAAAVNYVHHYEVVKPHTVDGTRRVLELACLGKTLHYISTNGIYPGGGHYLEDRNIDKYFKTLEGGYGLAKWVAEKLVWQAIDRGLPVVLYRPGNIGHHSLTGAPNPNDFQYLMVLGCLKLKRAPDVSNWFFEFTPVDFLVEAMTTFAEGDRFGQVYNVVQRPTVPAREFFDRLIKAGVLEGYLALDQWLERLKEGAVCDGEESLEVLANSLPDVEGYLSDTSIYDNTRFFAELDRHDLGRPPAGLDYLSLMVDRGVVHK